MAVDKATNERKTPKCASLQLLQIAEGASEFTFQAQSMAASVAATLALYFALQGTGYGGGDTLVQVWYAERTMYSSCGLCFIYFLFISLMFCFPCDHRTCLIFLQLMRGITASWKIAEKGGPIDILTADSPAIR